MSNKSENQEIQFKSGDVVRLKSGGPKMTVHSVDGFDPILAVIDCRWFVGGEIKGANFLPETLKMERSAMSQAKERLERYDQDGVLRE